MLLMSYRMQFGTKRVKSLINRLLSIIMFCECHRIISGCLEFYDITAILL